MTFLCRLKARTTYWRLDRIEQQLTRNEEKQAESYRHKLARGQRAHRCSMGLHDKRDHSYIENAVQRSFDTELSRLKHEWQALDDRRTDLRRWLRNHKFLVPPLGVALAA